MNEPTRARPVFHALRVADLERLTDDSVAITFDVPDELVDDFTFRPGQSLTLRRAVGGDDERRSYSICAQAGAAPRIGVREVPGGAMSPFLVHDVRVGDTLDVLAPQGRFVPELTGDVGRHVLVAAGSGITPMLGIAASLLAADAEHVTLFYGNRRTDTVMFLDELADLKDRHHTSFELVHVLSREPREAELLSGRIDAERLRELLAALVPVEAVDGWWLCGPHEMVSDARDLLVELDVPPERIHRELFYVEEEPPEERERAREEAAATGDETTATVILDGRRTSVAVAPGVPVLDAAQRLRSDLPFACKGGVCGTCRARVTDGQVQMRRNFALDEDELAAGFVLTCQAVPTTREVTVDYDA